MNQLKQLEQEWLNSQKRYNAKELLEIFPEAREYLEGDKRFSLLCIEVFEDIIRYKLERIAEIKDEFTRWFTEEVLKIIDGAILEKHEKRLKYLYFFLSPVKKGRITDEDILRAKEYPFDQLIEFKKGFALCPFHEEKTPSLSWNKKNNKIHCFGACSKSWDTIQFLIDSEGVSFIEAVKKLQ
jgi:hypothetical protein